MMMSGTFATYTRSGAIPAEGQMQVITKEKEPYVIRPSLLTETSSDFVLECLLKRLPWKFEGPAEVSRLAASHDLEYLNMCMDMASANLRLME